MAIEMESRKARRKKERAEKKLKRRRLPDLEDEPNRQATVTALPKRQKKHPSSASANNSTKSRLKNTSKRSISKDPYANMDAATASAMRRDDEEIAALEAKLGLSDKKEKSRLNKEYAKLEGYGDDFGDFLDDLDDMVHRVAGGKEEGADSDSDDEVVSEEEMVEKPKKKQKREGYNQMDSNTAAALRRDDEEIAALEAKLGLSDKKEKSRLYKEYAKLEGYGDDFGEFLDDLDGMVDRVMTGDYNYDERETMDVQERYSDSDESGDDEAVPMKDPAFDGLDEDDSVMDEIEAEGEMKDATNDPESYGSDSSESGDEAIAEQEPDHDENLTYRPTSGEDIYGNKIDEPQVKAEPKKYIPPHLRKKQAAAGDDADEEKRQESLRVIRRSLNNVLNRLSEDTLVSVSQSLAQLYATHPTADVNECVWKNAKNACVATSHEMIGLIPVYIGALAGVHAIKGDSAQLGEYLMEKIVLDLCQTTKAARDRTSETAEELNDGDAVSKEASNLTLCLCYLYNFGVIHCSLLYDIVRNLIENFSEIDVELLLLILRHCGRSLRTDDPSALREIILLVQKRALETKGTSSNESRVDYMVTAMMDLKNNKRRNAQATAIAEKTGRLRKYLGRIKSGVAASTGGFRAGSMMQRISLSDILNADTKGRFWKVGASWAGNQYRFEDGTASEDNFSGNAGRRHEDSSDEELDEEDQKLLKLASKYRMNSDVRRSIFRIVMGSADFEDAFEKLVRSNLLKNRTERETVRVIMECCGNEKSFNKYYAHLAARICEFQPQCKFSFQLAFWDAFKTFDDKARKAANLAKLLFSLVVTHHSLRLHMLKAIDMSSPEDLSETTMIFLTVFLGSLLEHYEDPGDVARLFETGINKRKEGSQILSANGESDHAVVDDGDALRANLTVFLVQVLKSSPKYKKGSKFRANLKAAVKACDTDDFY